MPLLEERLHFYEKYNLISCNIMMHNIIFILVSTQILHAHLLLRICYEVIVDSPSFILIITNTLLLLSAIIMLINDIDVDGMQY